MDQNVQIHVAVLLSLYLSNEKKNTWKVLPLHNVVGPCFTEEFWPPVSSHVSVFPFLCLQQPLVFVLKVSTFLTLQTQSKPQSILTKDTAPLVWTRGNFTCEFIEFWFGSNRKGETKQIRCRSQWTGLPHTFVCVWGFLVISTTESVSIH